MYCSVAQRSVALSFVERSSRQEGRHCSHFILVMLVADVCLFGFIQLNQKVILEELDGCSEFLIELCRKDQADSGV